MTTTSQATSAAAGNTTRDAALHAYAALVDAYSWGFGTENAHVIVGSTLLLLLAVVTLMTASCAFREIGAIGIKFMKVVLLTFLALFLGSLTLPLYEFVFPTAQARAEAFDAAKYVATDAPWFVARWWRTAAKRAGGAA